MCIRADNLAVCPHNSVNMSKRLDFQSHGTANLPHKATVHKDLNRLFEYNWLRNGELGVWLFKGYHVDGFVFKSIRFFFS